MRKIYHKFISLMLSVSYKITHKIELKELELSDYPCLDDYNFYREAFELYQNSRSSNNIDNIINNSESLEKGLKEKYENDQFSKYKEKYENYSIDNKETKH